jgi:hypothetical protein
MGTVIICALSACAAARVADAASHDSPAAAPVFVYSARADEQAGGDFGVGQAAPDQGQHLSFAFGDAADLALRRGRVRPASELGDEAAGDAGRDQRVAGGDDL